MVLDIRGSLKNTKINKDYFIVFDELLSNAIDSYLIRKFQYKNIEPLCIKFIIDIISNDIIEEKYNQNLTIQCIDNGIGFGDEQIEAFTTKDTSYKDDLEISGIQKCRGTGRIQYFHYFEKININSIFKNKNEWIEKLLNIDINKDKFIKSDHFKENIASEKEEYITMTSLSKLKKTIQDNMLRGKDLKEEFSASSLKQHVIKTFLQKFVGLQNVIGEFIIEFKTTCGHSVTQDSLQHTDLPECSRKENISIYYRESNGTYKKNQAHFSINHYRLDKNKFEIQENIIALCAKSSLVKKLNDIFLNKNKALENNDINGFYHIILIESEYLDDRVNEKRDDFDIPKEEKNLSDYLEPLIPFEDIINHIGSIIHEMLNLPKWQKDIIIKNITQKYGITSDMISRANVRIPYGDNEERVVKRVLNSFSDKIVDDTSCIIEIKNQILNINPLDDTYRDKVQELSWKYSSSMKEFDMLNLSQLVVRRASVLEILKHSVTQTLNSQMQHLGQKRNEAIIHKIFFPTRKDSTEIQEHDIWILSEEYQYYHYIASDMPLSKIKIGQGTLIFQDDIDKNIENIYKKNTSSNSQGRPDIAIFDKEGSVIIVEFKSPGVSLDNHLQDLSEYATLLIAKSNGFLKKAYGYLIGDTINSNRMAGYTKFPNSEGYFSTIPLRDPSTNYNIGELYAEILHFNDVIDKADKRLKVYQEKLNLDLRS